MKNIPYKLTTYKDCYRVAKMEKKMNLFRNIAIILRNEIRTPTNFTPNVEEVFEHILRSGIVTNDYYGFVRWLGIWDKYFLDTTAIKRLKDAQKGKRPNYFF